MFIQGVLVYFIVFDEKGHVFEITFKPAQLKEHLVIVQRMWVRLPYKLTYKKIESKIKPKKLKKFPTRINSVGNHRLNF